MKICINSKCKEQGAEFSPHFNYCPFCGYVLVDPPIVIPRVEEEKV